MNKERLTFILEYWDNNNFHLPKKDYLICRKNFCNACSFYSKCDNELNTRFTKSEIKHLNKKYPEYFI